MNEVGSYRGQEGSNFVEGIQERAILLSIHFCIDNVLHIQNTKLTRMGKKRKCRTHKTEKLEQMNPTKFQTNNIATGEGEKQN